jgi:hypothetical protein
VPVTTFEGGALDFLQDIAIVNKAPIAAATKVSLIGVYVQERKMTGAYCINK